LDSHLFRQPQLPFHSAPASNDDPARRSHPWGRAGAFPDHIATGKTALIDTPGSKFVDLCASQQSKGLFATLLTTLQQHLELVFSKVRGRAAMQYHAAISLAMLQRTMWMCSIGINPCVPTMCLMTISSSPILIPFP
jgi:hypothetical protein